MSCLLFFLFSFEPVSLNVALSVLELSMRTRIALNSETCPCLCLLKDKTESIGHQTQSLPYILSLHLKVILRTRSLGSIRKIKALKEKGNIFTKLSKKQL